MRTKKPLIGIVEGFYGQAWRWQERRSYANYLTRFGLNTFLYAPKSDVRLRSEWRQNWSASELEEIRLTAAYYRDRGLIWGMGLSPYALYQRYDQADRIALREKIARIDSFGGSLLAVLFDDMPGDLSDLADRQVEIITDVLHWTDAETVLMCPTYYSFDPVLEQHFGAMPQGYWENLGAQLDPDVGVFWTGNTVCSPSITVSDVEAIRQRLGRAPILWDNYPVNDGAAMTDFLHLQPLPARDQRLSGVTAGHLCNPMNQAALSQYPLGGLAALYGASEPALETLYPAKLAALLRRDLQEFEQVGLAGMGDARREELIKEYGCFGDAAAVEVVRWLSGEYAFDPACLTG